MSGFDVDIVMSALDADVIKTYVELNMGVGIVNDVAYDPERDYRLKQIPTDIFGSIPLGLLFAKDIYYAVMAMSLFLYAHQMLTSKR